MVAADPISIAALVATLKEKEAEYTAAIQAEKDAWDKKRDALQQVNEIQKKIDAAVFELFKDPMVETHWANQLLRDRNIAIKKFSEFTVSNYQQELSKVESNSQRLTEYIGQSIKS